jgi:transketolase C-terminal domain/subunit
VPHDGRSTRCRTAPGSRWRAGGAEVAILACGTMVMPAVEAAEALAAEGST